MPFAFRIPSLLGIGKAEPANKVKLFTDDNIRKEFLAELLKLISFFGKDNPNGLYGFFDMVRINYHNFPDKIIEAIKAIAAERAQESVNMRTKLQELVKQAANEAFKGMINRIIAKMSDIESYLKEVEEYIGSDSFRKFESENSLAIYNSSTFINDNLAIFANNLSGLLTLVQEPEVEEPKIARALSNMREFRQLMRGFENMDHRSLHEQRL